MTSEAPLHIVELTTENVKRIRAATVRPNGSVVIIGGHNAQGKSSLIDSIEMALAGAKTIPQEPVRHGARKARIVVDLGEIVVERTFSAKGTELVVRGRDGVPRPSPQRLLDTLTAKVTFDPLQFARMEPKLQDELLKKLIGLDFSDIEAARAKVYEKRTEAGRDLKRLEALLDSKQRHADAPKVAVDVAALSEQLATVTASKTARAAAETKVYGLKLKLEQHDEKIAEVEAQLTKLRFDRGGLSDAIDKAEAELPLALVGAEELQEKLRTAEATNAKVRANADFDALEKNVAAKAKEVEEHAATIASLDDEKAERLAAAKFPIPGLGFDDAGPTFNGVPLAQASQAERLRLSVAIGAAMNPRVRVMLIREGSLLDEHSMALLAKLADETGSQLWVERVGTGDPAAVIIEDGSVVEPAAEAVNGNAATAT